MCSCGRKAVCKLNGELVCGICGMMYTQDDLSMSCWDVCPQHNCAHCYELEYMCQSINFYK